MGHLRSLLAHAISHMHFSRIAVCPDHCFEWVSPRVERSDSRYTTYLQASDATSTHVLSRIPRRYNVSISITPTLCARETWVPRVTTFLFHTFSIEVTDDTGMYEHRNAKVPGAFIAKRPVATRI
ncbi:hypothetical protein NPIL_151051 [Nephila pilipes]|uniref:Uncharacterized protein n=1 Tax=Nephila pilipes TaxID=299642 RepID=A0A8X6NHN2_NEPPI|nr:hypothetical protein NPIL_151051 [Nephila pilipes]